MSSVPGVVTALIVKVPEADRVVAPFRKTMDPAAAWGIPAHITILYPFLPVEELTADVVARLTDAFAGVPRFQCSFERTGWFNEQVMWLAPEPVDPFHVLTQRVWDEFPECPPYRGVHRDVVPHLTVGDRASGAPIWELRRAEHGVRKCLPFALEVDKVSLVAGNHLDATWSVRHEFGLA